MSEEPKTEFSGGKQPAGDHTEINPATGQQKAYVVLTAEERAKGFVRPVRYSYVHVGNGGPKHPTRPLTAEEQARYAAFNYELYEQYPPSESSVVGKFWTKEALAAAKGCGALTRMARDIAETYARDPKFYGGTFCVGCRKHLPLEEFRWDGTDEVVGS